MRMDDNIIIFQRHEAWKEGNFLKSSGGKSIRVMTWNLYLGAPVDYTVPDLQSVPFIVQEFWNRVQATCFPARAHSIAKIIAQYKPDVIAFQEAVKYYIQQPGDFFGVNTQATEEVLDFIKVLRDLLFKHGTVYEECIINQATDIELPSAGGYDLRVIDRQVILIKNTDLKHFVKVEQTRSGVFKERLSFPVAGLPFHITRGWAMADLLFDHAKIRIVTAHLEPASKDVRLGQAAELAAGPCRTNLPLIVAGDFNAEPLADRPGVYQAFMKQGFHDAWLFAGRGKGNTCCQAGDLLNFISQLSRRIDWILFKGGLNIRAVLTVGDKEADRGSGGTGLWPSDHGGLVGEFIFK